MSRAQISGGAKVLPLPGVIVTQPAPEGGTAMAAEPNYLTPSFLVRLATLNTATREIRRLGYHIVWSKMAGQVPQIHLQRGDKSMSPMLDRIANKIIADCDEGGYKSIRGAFMGCQVSWLEPM